MRAVSRCLPISCAIAGAVGCSALESPRSTELSEPPAIPAWAQTLSLAALAPAEPDPPKRRVQSLWPAPLESAKKPPLPRAQGKKRDREVRGPEAGDIDLAADDAPVAVLVATSKQTPVYARPSLKAAKIGYLRAGAVVQRDRKPSGFEGCPAGFYGVAPEGFVCVGSAASVDAEHELARASVRRADRTSTLPYVYGIAPAGAPLYARIPSAEEQRLAEPDLSGPRRSPTFDGVPVDAIPWFLEGGATSIRTSGTRFSQGTAYLRRSIPRSGAAFVSIFESGGRKFGLTGDMAIAPLDRYGKVEPSRFRGMPLSAEAPLPVAFVRSRSATLYAGDPRTAGLRAERRLEYREAVSLEGTRVTNGGVSYLKTRDGHWLVDQSLLRVEPRESMPSWAASSSGTGRTWIDVSIDRQTLVAYEGARPVFVTLVSTGADGTGDPETTHSTIQGEFALHTKHVSVTMDGDEVGDEYDLRDVPYVQYFKEGYALHAAYWHDGFGTPRSHGCINLSPLDARWLFSWTSPSVPATWHGAMSPRGTLISIHP
jgi:hypothetical protein